MKIIRVERLSSAFFAFQEDRASARVRRIVRQVRREGDAALRLFTARYDGVTPDRWAVPAEELQHALHQAPRPWLAALRRSAANIRRFARRQMRQFRDFDCSVQPGVFAGQRVAPLERVGVYVPGGRFPLVSSLLMGVIPAQVAGVPAVAVCSPPGPDGRPAAAVLAAAALVGVTEVYAAGGAQAVAALAYGTESVARVDKIVGPGNRYVALAKREVAGGVGIDFFAGPSEILIIADDTADPALVAADLLAQAEHDADAAAVLLTPSMELARRVRAEVRRQAAALPTAAVARAALRRRGCIVLVDDLDQAVAVADRRAPEHLEIQTADAERVAGRCRHYGSLFIGARAGEALGDYSSGLNHILPTNTAARYTAGLSVRDFLRLQTVLRVTEEGVRRIAPAAARLADGEGLAAHAASLRRRLPGTGR